MQNNIFESDDFIVEPVSATPNPSESDEATISEEDKYSSHDEQNKSDSAEDQLISLQHFIDNSIKVTTDFSESDSIQLVITNIKKCIYSLSNNTGRINFDHYYSLLANLFNLLNNTEKLDDDQSGALIEFYLQEMTDTEQLILEKNDPMMFRFFMNKDKLKSLVGEFILFSIAKFSDTHQDKLFRLFLEILRNPSKKLLPVWVYEESILGLAEIMKHERMSLILEFYIKKLDEDIYGHTSYDLLMYILLNYCQADYRFKFFKYLHHLLEIHGQFRVKQKNFQYFFVSIYNRLKTEQEKQQVFNKIVLPMLKSEDIYLRESLAEMLVKLKPFPDNGQELLGILVKDDNEEVRRLAENARARLEKSAQTESDRSGSSDSQGYLDNLDIDSSEANSVLSDSLQEQKLEQEFEKFKKSIKPQDFKQEFAKGINHQNRHIREYCWTWLHNFYMSSVSSERQKMSWINIIFDAFKKDIFYYSEIEFIDYLYWNLRPIKALSLSLIQNILILLKNKCDINFCEWTNLLNCLLSKDIEQAIIKKVINVYQEIIIFGKCSISAKEIILQNIAAIQWCCDDYLTITIPVLIKIAERARSKITNLAYGIISELLFDISDVSHLKPELCETLTRINPNQTDPNNVNQFNIFIEQLLGFLVYVIAQNGEQTQGKYATNAILNIISTSENVAHAVIVKTLLDDYGITRLAMLAKINESIEKKITIDEVWSAYNKMTFLNDSTMMQSLWKRKKVKSINRQHSIFLIASCFIKQSRLDEANSYLCRSEETNYYPLFIFLKAEIKYFQQKYSESIQLYQEFLRDYPFYIQAKIRIYEAYQRLGAFTSEQAVRQEVLIMSPSLKATLIASPSRTTESNDLLVLSQTVAYAEQDLNEFIKNFLNLIQDKSFNYDEKEKTIINFFNQLKQKLMLYFGSNVIEQYFKDRLAINWSAFIKYPHQLFYFMKDILIGILHIVVPKQSVKLYNAYQTIIKRMCELDKYIDESKICDFIREIDPKEFLKNKVHVITAYNFIKEYAFSEEMINACALGLSSDITGAYNVLVGMLRLKHWQLVYQEVSVEPSGTTQHTNEFMQKVLLRKQPVVLFVPVIVKTTDIDNPTLDEIKYLIRTMKERNLKNKVYLVFGAYEFLPIYAQDIEPLSQTRSAGYIFRNMLDHIVRLFAIKLHNRDESYRTTMEHMLATRIQINAIAVKPADETLCDELENDIYQLISGENSKEFSNILQSWITKIPKPKQLLRQNMFRYMRKDWEHLSVILDILDALLFTGMPWFGSKYQLGNTEIVVNLKNILLETKRFFNEDFNEQVFDSSSRQALKRHDDEISNFLRYLDQLILTIEDGLKWRGISDFQFSPLSRKDNRSQHQQLYKATQLSSDKAKPSALTNKSTLASTRKTKTGKITYDATSQITPCKTAPKAAWFSENQAKLSNVDHLAFLKAYFRKARVTLDISEKEYLLAFDNRTDCDNANGILYQIENSSENTWERLSGFDTIRVQVGFIPRIINISSIPSFKNQRRF